MSLSEQKIAERIAKLLRLWRSSNPHEAAKALERARALADKYRMDLEALGEDPVGERQVEDASRLQLEKRLVIALVELYFCVKIVVGRPQVIFIGREAERIVASYVYAFLVRACRSGLNNYRRRERRSRRKWTARKRESWIDGFLAGVAQNVDFDPVGDRAEVYAYTRRQYPALRPSAPRRAPGSPHKNAMVAGYVQGVETHVRRPLNGRRQLVLALEGGTP